MEVRIAAHSTENTAGPFASDPSVGSRSHAAQLASTITAPVEMPTVEQPHAATSEPEETATVANVPLLGSLRSEAAVEPRHPAVSVDAVAIDSPVVISVLPAPMSARSVTREAIGRAYTSSVTTYAADGSISSVDLYGFARTFDHVRLDYRADASLHTRTLLDTENPAAAIVIDYDEAGARIARHEIALPDRPYGRLDIVYDAEGWAETRTRSGFADGDIVSVTVRFDAPGTIARVEHLHVDGTRLIVGTAEADALAGHGGDRLVGRDGGDTFVLLDADPRALEIADFKHAEGDHLDLSALLSGDAAHVLGGDAFDGSADAVRFDRVPGGSLLSIDLDGDKVADASVLLHGVHGVHAADFGF